VTITIIECLVSTKELQASIDISIYPNPSSGIFNVEVEENLEMIVYDIAGVKIFDQEITRGLNSIDLKDGFAGLYVLKVFREGVFVGVERVVVY